MVLIKTLSGCIVNFKLFTLNYEMRQSDFSTAAAKLLTLGDFLFLNHCEVLINFPLNFSAKFEHLFYWIFHF